MLIFWVRTELVDTGFESPRVTCSSTFSCCLLLVLQLLLPLWLASASLLFPVWSPIITPPPFTFPQARFFSCSVMLGWECTQPLPGTPGPGHSLLLSSAMVMCNAVLVYLAAGRQHTQVGSQAGFILKPLSWWISVAIENSSAAEEVLVMPHLLVYLCWYWFSYEKGDNLYFGCLCLCYANFFHNWWWSTILKVKDHPSSWHACILCRKSLISHRKIKDGEI